jgi:spore coat polysaccharide biosynthesis protein SpsF
VFIQARMSSARFPGKVLAPFRGRPIIWHVIDTVTKALPDLPRTVVTSTASTDDPLVAYLDTLPIPVVRGSLLDVAERFRLAMRQQPAAWVLRVSADSPVLCVPVLRRVVAAASTDWDLITTTFPRTFPKGQNAELMRADAFMRIDADRLDADDREHVTRFFYRHPTSFRILNVFSGDQSLANQDLAIDTVDDLQRLESSSDGDVAAWRSGAHLPAAV